MKKLDSAQKNPTELVKTRLSRAWKRWRCFRWEPVFITRTSPANLKLYLRQRTDPFLPLIATEGQLKSKTLHPQHAFSLQPSSNSNQKLLLRASACATYTAQSLLVFCIVSGSCAENDPLDFKSRRGLAAQETNR